MNRRSTLFAVMIIAMLCAAALSGCTDPKAAAAGTYEVDKAAFKAAAEADIKAKGENDPNATPAAMLLGMIDDMVMTLTLNADGTASMQSSIMGETQTGSGTWTLNGKSISITAGPSGETPETFSGTIEGDAITLKAPPGQDMPFELVFKKRKS